MADSTFDLLTRRRLLQTLGLTSLAIAFPTDLLAATSAKAGRKTAAPPRLLMIDPGHGGRDPGAIGRNGTYEKDVVLDISRQLANELNKLPGLQVKLTRNKDEFIPLRDRVKIAQNAKCDLFVSIHADSAPDRSARGLSAYTLSEKASDDFSSSLAKQENLADMMGGVDIKDTDEQVAGILIDLAARHTKTASLKAKMELVSGVGHDWPLLENPIRSANFAVLRAPDLPSMLIETGFLSNERDEKVLQDRDNRRKIASLFAREFKTILNSAPFV
jgi:N-acetylmuramoyl-L-alanine amidase